MNEKNKKLREAEQQDDKGLDQPKPKLGWPVMQETQIDYLRIKDLIIQI